MVNEIVGYLMFIGLLFAFFLPTFLGAARHHPYHFVIFAVNLTLGWTPLGWTLLGWIVALVWSLSSSRPAASMHRVIHQQR